MRSGVNFTKVLCTAFTLADPESIKKILLSHQYLFTLSGSACIKAVHRTLMKLRSSNNGYFGITFYILNFGLFKLRIIQTSDYSNIGLFKLRIIQASDYSNFRLFKLWIILTSDYSDFGLLELWIIWILDYSNFGLFELRIIQIEYFSNWFTPPILCSFNKN